MPQLLIYGYLVVAVTVLTTSLGVTANQCTKYHFKTPFLPGMSCEDIYEKNPESRDRPGYYWIIDGPRKVYCGMNYSGSSCEDIYTSNPEISGNNSGYYRISDQWIYCNFTVIATGFTSTCAGRGGRWTRIGYFNISAGDNCPTGWKKDTQSGVGFCRPPGDDSTAGYLCYSTYLSTNGMAYTSVCGRARGYQKGNVWGFWGSTTAQGNSIEGSYVDGLSITHGTGPRHHIWTYAVGQYDHSSVSWGCPCSQHRAITPPSYVNDHYYCESGAFSNPPSGSTYFFSDPLWDGSGCSSNNNCCSINENQPCFYRNLGSSTTDDIEARLCITYATYAAGAVVLDQLELYIQ